MKKLLSFMLAICLIVCGCVASASDANSAITVSNDDIVTVPTQNTKPGISTFAWGGTAAQITKIELYDYGWMNDSGNFCVLLKVTGYGHDKATFNGKAINSDIVDYFINFGNTADGFIYLYDCGPVTEPGTYPFEVTFTSTNSPYSKLTYRDAFTFSPKA